MREHPSGHFSWTYDSVHKTIPYGGIQDEIELRKKLAMARTSAALSEERTNKRISNQKQPSRSIKDYLHWIESELHMKDDRSMPAADQACLARYPDGTFRISMKEIQPSPQQALLWKKVSKLKSLESRRSQDSEALQLRGRRSKQNFETKRRLTQSEHRAQGLKEAIIDDRDDDDTAESTSATAILKDLGMLPCGTFPTGLSLTSTLTSAKSTCIRLLNDEQSIQLFDLCSSFQLQDWSRTCRPVHREQPESSRNTSVAVLGLDEHRDAYPLKANLLDDELESSTKFCTGQGINRWLIRRNASNR